MGGSPCRHLGACFFQLMVVCPATPLPRRVKLEDSVSPQAPEQAGVETFRLFGRSGAWGEKAEGLHPGKGGMLTCHPDYSHPDPPLFPGKPISHPSLLMPLFFGNYDELHVIISAGPFLEEAFAVPPSRCPSPPQSASSRDVSSPAGSSKTSQDHLFRMRPVACSPESVSAGARWVLAAGGAIPGIGTGVWLGSFFPLSFFFFAQIRIY